MTIFQIVSFAAGPLVAVAGFGWLAVWSKRRRRALGLPPLPSRKILRLMGLPA